MALFGFFEIAVHESEQIDEEGIDIENVSSHNPTLDDVFLILTGRTMEQNNDISQSEKKELGEIKEQ